MSFSEKKGRSAWLALFLSTLLCIAPVSAEEYFDRYDLSPALAVLDLGAQPLGYPSGVISSVMQRDRRLQAALQSMGIGSKVYPFKRGADMIGLLSDGRLEAGLLGDLPTILTASARKVWIVGLVKQTSTAIVAKGDTQVGALIGKKIAYVPISSAHHTLLQGLASAGLKEDQVTLVSMGVEAMPLALARGEVDAFAAWEPAPTIALEKSTENRIVFRGRSSDYFVLERGFEAHNPEAARVLVAGFVRAIEWMRRSQKNVGKAARWVLADGEKFAGKPMVLSVEQIVAITRREILNIPSAPVILPLSSGERPLKSEFDFLQRMGKLPKEASWENLSDSFAYEGLKRVLSERQKYQITAFDYEE